MTEQRATERDPMTGAAFKVARERLGLPADWIAEHFDVAERTVRRWENGVSRVPEGVRVGIEQLQLEHEAAAERLEVALQGMPDPVLATYRVDSHYAACEPDARRPASWHRAVVGRIAERRPGVTIVYQEP